MTKQSREFRPVHTCPGCGGPTMIDLAPAFTTGSGPSGHDERCPHATEREEMPRMAEVKRINITVRADALVEIDRAAAAAGESRSQYLTAAALGRARGRLEVEDALAVIREALGH